MANNEDFLKHLKQIFKIEAIENIDTVLNEMLGIEKAFERKSEETVVLEDESRERLEIILRQLHSLKGSARSVSITDIVNICQSLESAFIMLKKEQLSLNKQFFDVTYHAVNTVKSIVEDSETKHSIYPVIKSLNELQNNKIIKQEIGKPKIEQKVEISEIKNEEKVEESKERKEPEKEDKIVITESNLEKEKQITQLINNENKTNTPASTKKTTAETIRIDVNKLDKLLNHAEDMLSIKLNSEQQNKFLINNRDLMENYFSEQNKLYYEFKKLSTNIQSIDRVLYNKINEIIDHSYKKEKSIRENFNNLINQSEQNKDEVISKIDDLLNQVKKTVTFPIGTILSHFPIMVRDISKEINKDIDLIINGENIEVDKRILEEIKEPLLHLVRNSIDHGIEAVKDRGNKPSRGTIKINVEQTDNNKVEVRVYDDGKGLNYKKIKEKIIEFGILTESELQNLTDDEVANYIFNSGLSTSPIITNISGRGLGLAIVKEKIEKIGGSINVISKFGEYSEFIIKLPLTLSTFKGLLVKVSEKMFVIPLNNVQKTVRVNINDIKSVEGKKTINIDGEILSCFYLSDILKLNYSHTHKAQEFLQIVIICLLDKKIAIWVDEVLYEQEVMVKTLGKQLSRIRNIAGLTLLGSGQNVPLLNFSDIFKYIQDNKFISSQYVNETSKKVKHKILIAEDSITSRTLIKNILESAGYDVTTAIDGMEAYNNLEIEKFDLLVSDVEMPRMNGFELTAKVRENKKLFELPVILITSLSSKEHREKGIEVGANAYIVKSELEQDYLLNIIPRLL